MTIVTDNRVAEFVATRTGVPMNPPFTCMGIERDGEIVAGVVFNVFTGPDIHVTAAGTGWTRGFIREIGRYVFKQLGCIRMTVTTRSSNVVGFAQRLGGKIEGHIRDLYGPGQPGTIVGILASEWRL